MAKMKCIPIDIYRLNLEVFVGSLKEFRAFIENLCKEDESYKAIVDNINDNIQGADIYEAATYWNNYERRLIIYLPSLSLKPHCINITVHELSHATQYILDDVSIRIDSSNYEAYAYLIGYLVEQVYTKDGYETI